MQFAHSKAVALSRVGECMIYKLQNYNCQPLSITLLSKAIARKANHAILLIHTHSIIFLIVTSKITTITTLVTLWNIAQLPSLLFICRVAPDSIGPSIRISTEVVIPNVTKSVFVRRLF